MPPSFFWFPFPKGKGLGARSPCTGINSELIDKPGVDHLVDRTLPHRCQVEGNHPCEIMEEVILRFLVGGLIVSVFAVLGDLFEPKSFAGIFGAAPSVALATLALTISSKGKGYAALELRATVAGAIAFFVYASAVARTLMSYNLPAILVASILTTLWMAIAAGLWAVLLR